MKKCPPKWSKLNPSVAFLHSGLKVNLEPCFCNNKQENRHFRIENGGFFTGASSKDFIIQAKSEGMCGLFLLKRTTGPYSRFQRPIEIRGSCTAINEEISTGDESAFAAHQQFRHISLLILRDQEEYYTR